ncbi:MAG: hypothetical protein LRY56_04110 [Burkholderiaceae bacterium]|nr:hypothetical protein [Burkholderiaceae bacterium]MCD8536716.1 hypothetical protein [Burkholderiaceae bacterium]
MKRNPLFAVSGLVLALGSTSVSANYWTEPWLFDMPQAPAWRAGQTAWTWQTNYGADPWPLTLDGAGAAGIADFVFIGQPLIIDPVIWQNLADFPTGGPNAVTDNSRRGSSVVLQYNTALPAISVSDAFF